MKEIENELSEVTDWHQLGVQLGLTTGELESIEKDHSQNKRRKSEILICWLRNGNEVSWGALAKALKQCGYNTIAQKLRRNMPSLQKGYIFVLKIALVYNIVRCFILIWYRN